MEPECHRRANSEFCKDFYSCEPIVVLDDDNDDDDENNVVHGTSNLQVGGSSSSSMPAAQTGDDIESCTDSDVDDSGYTEEWQRQYLAKRFSATLREQSTPAAYCARLRAELARERAEIDADAVARISAEPPPEMPKCYAHSSLTRRLPLRRSRGRAHQRCAPCHSGP